MCQINMFQVFIDNFYSNNIHSTCLKQCKRLGYHLCTIRTVSLLYFETFLISYKCSYILFSLSKKYSKIDQHLARHFKYNVAFLWFTPPFL